MREKNKVAIEVHVAGFVFRNNHNIVELLIGKRSPKRELFPNYWECGGGQVFTHENFEMAVVRQIKEEFNVNIKVIGVVGTYEIKFKNIEQEVIPGVQLAAVIIDGEAKVDGEEMVCSKWINSDEVEEIEFIPGMKKDVLKGFAIAKKYYF